VLVLVVMMVTPPTLSHLLWSLLCLLLLQLSMGKKYNYSNKNDYNNKNDNKNDYKKKNRFEDKERNIKKIMS
jgi:hypothetical protein